MFFFFFFPIYNAAQSLERCLDSVCLQSFDDYEVIMIDDGSRDNSRAICEGYAEKDARFKLVYQENRGPSAARNTGLRMAEGRYLCFVDSDDYVSSDYLDQLYKKIETSGAEVIFFGYHNVNQNGNITVTRIPSTNGNRIDMLTDLSERDMFGYTWIKCFARKAVGNCKFSEEMFLFEDEVFTCSVLKNTYRIAVLPQALYYYVNGGSNMLTGRTYENYCVLSDKVFSAWEDLLWEVPNREAFLRKKADYFVGRCRYYGLEKEVNYSDFFESLAKTHFFQLHSKWSMLDRFIRHRNWFAVKVSIILYRIKNRIHFIK